MILANPEAQYLLDFVEAWKPQRTLEVGCHRGTEAKLIENLTEIHGVDLDPSAIEEAQKSVKGFFKVADGSKLPYDDSTFDLVYSCGGVLSHNSPDKAGAILSEMFRVAKGKILLVEYQGTRTSAYAYTNVKRGSYIHDIEMLCAGQVFTPIMSKTAVVGFDKFHIFACDKGIVGTQARAIAIEARLDKLEERMTERDAKLQADFKNVNEKTEGLIKLMTKPSFWSRIKNILKVW